MAKLVFAFVISLLLTQWANAQDTKPLTTEELASHTIYRRIVDAVIWGLPLVGEDAVQASRLPRWQGELQRHRLVTQRGAVGRTSRPRPTSTQVAPSAHYEVGTITLWTSI